MFGNVLLPSLCQSHDPFAGVQYDVCAQFIDACKERAFTLRALTNSYLWRIGSKDLQLLTRHHPHVMAMLAKSAAEVRA